MAKFYQVGGCVRDKFLGKQSKDIDFSVEAESYEAMRAAIRERCGADSVKVEHPEHVTIRGVDPVLGGVDFVLCRKEGPYSDGRRPDWVSMGTLADDLARRDFTVNAMAEDDSGAIIDPFNGQRDLEDMLLRCVGDTRKRLTEDSLRMIRAIRFAITKNFRFDADLYAFLRNTDNAVLLENISIERIYDELKKCFEFNTLHTLDMLRNFPAIEENIFSRNLVLTPKVVKK